MWLVLRPWTRLLKNPRDRADVGADVSEDVKETFVFVMMRVKDGIHHNSRAWEILPACMTERDKSHQNT